MSAKKWPGGLSPALVAFVLVHCCLTVAGAKAPVPKPPPPPTISVGQPLEEALDALHATKARDISATISTFIGVPFDEAEPRYELRWFILRDGTCLQMLIRRESARGKATIADLELGEKGKGYGGKIRWSEEREKHRHVSSLELP